MVDPEKGLSAEARGSIEKNALLNAVRHSGKADMGAVMSKVLGEFPDLRHDPASVASAVKEVLKRVNAMNPSDQASLLESKYPGSIASAQRSSEPHRLPPLDGAVKGETSFRLPPEPSGYMTIGHAMAFTVNSLYRDMYDGELWLRFEDTNPRKVGLRYYESFRRGIAWLGIRYDHEKNLSSDMEVFYENGRRLLERGAAYACACGPDKVKKLRFDGTECEHRGGPVEKSLRIWEELLAKRHHEGDYVIRFKGDMKNLNYSLRDPNIFRVIDHSHPVTGEKYSLWPTYDLANAIEDDMCGTTHILRSSEFHTEFQQVIRETLGLKDVRVIQFSRYNFRGTPVGKRFLRPLVEQKLISGWDDPRMPTVEGVRRRGILPEAIREFTQQVGYSKAEHEYDWSLLFSVNRKLLDPVSRRIFFVPGPVALAVESAPSRSPTIPFHPERDLGSRKIETAGVFFVPSADTEPMEEGTLFRLMDLYNVRLTGKRGGMTAEYAGDELLPETKKLQWVVPDHSEVKVQVYDPLYDEAGDFIKPGMKEVAGYAEEASSSLEVGDIVQFPRFGFCRKDAEGVFILAHR